MSSLRARHPADDRLRISDWHGDPTVAQVVPLAGRPLSLSTVQRCCDRLAGGGYREVLTAALAPAEQAPFLECGFAVHERLHLLARSLADPVPEGPPAELRRARRADRPRVLEVDQAAFSPFWHLDEAGLDDAVAATPATRFRVAEIDGTVQGFAVTGRAAGRGYLQRLAVDPATQRRGLGAALVLDGLRWLRRRGADEVLVNTQVGNDGAVQLYQRLGFVLRPGGLAVLRRTLGSVGR
ncbi:MAG: GNAT family N-acetyltransferase [Acidimicrobiia bacterium]